MSSSHSAARPAPTPAPQPEQVADALRSVIGELVRTVRHEAHTPSSAQSETLGFIDRHGPSSVSAIAAHRQVKHQSMRLVAEQLQAQGLVTRAPDPADGRKQLIALTAKGQATLELGRGRRAQWLAEQFKRHTTAAQLRTLSRAVAILERVLAADRP